MRRTILMTLALLALSTGGRAETPLMTEDQKALYALGVAQGQSMERFGFSADEAQLIGEGLVAALSGAELQVAFDDYRDKINEMLQARMAVAGQQELEAGQAFLTAEAGKDGAVQTESGLIYVELEAGTGASPTATDEVTVHYHGTLMTGEVFDSSVDRGEPATFALNRVIPAWTEGVQLMKVGGKAKLICPPDLAYGERGAGAMIGPNATLVFEVELIEIAKSEG